MSENVAFDTLPAPGTALPAEVTFAGRYRQKRSVPTVVTRLGQRSVTLSIDAERMPPDVGFLWVEVQLPAGAIRPLVQVIERGDGGVVGRFRHVFPDDRRALEAWHAERATAHGY